MVTNYIVCMDRFKVNSVVTLMSRKVKKINRFIEERLSYYQLEGIVHSHGDILATLFRYDFLSMKELAEKIDRDKSTLTGLVEKLVQTGYVRKEQCCRDKRVTYIKITEKGMALKPIFQQISVELMKRIYSGFTKEEKEKFVELLDKIDV